MSPTNNVSFTYPHGRVVATLNICKFEHSYDHKLPLSRFIFSKQLRVYYAAEAAVFNQYLGDIKIPNSGCDYQRKSFIRDASHLGWLGIFTDVLIIHQIFLPSIYFKLITY